MREGKKKAAANPRISCLDQLGELNLKRVVPKLTLTEGTPTPKKFFKTVTPLMLATPTLKVCMGHRNSLKVLLTRLWEQQERQPVLEARHPNQTHEVHPPPRRNSSRAPYRQRRMLVLGFMKMKRTVHLFR